MSIDLDKLVDDIPAFADLRSDERKLLAMVLHEDRFQSGESIFEEGERGRSCYFLAEGEVDIEKNVGPDEVRTLATLRSHALFGQIALIDSGPRSAGCRARSTSRLFRLDRQDFDTLFSSGSHFAFRFQLAISRIAVRQLREANRKLCLLLTARQKQRHRDSRPDVLREVQDILAMSDTLVDEDDPKWLG